MRISAFLGAALALAASPAGAWGVVGHAVVADIAEARLTPAAKKHVIALLALENQGRLAQISTWADDWGGLHKETKPWHYIDIPITAAGYDKARDCPDGNCIVARITDFLKVLKDKSASREDRLQALKFVVHFIGDLHQPLHAGENGDAGGNRVPVSYFGETTVYGQAKLNLHSLWDTALIERRTGIRESRDAVMADLYRAARKFETALPAIKEDAGAIDPIAWANQSHDLSRDVVYRGILKSGQPSPADLVPLDAEYDTAAWPVVERQLVRGGLRLAEALNDALN